MCGGGGGVCGVAVIYGFNWTAVNFKGVTIVSKIVVVVVVVVVYNKSKSELARKGELKNLFLG